MRVRGSTLECAAYLDVRIAKNVIAPEVIINGKEALSKIVRMLVGLIKANSTDRLYTEHHQVFEKAYGFFA